MVIVFFSSSFGGLQVKSWFGGGPVWLSVTVSATARLSYHLLRLLHNNGRVHLQTLHLLFPIWQVLAGIGSSSEKLVHYCMLPFQCSHICW
ncbi:hypothetical protein BDV24DRAFT_146332 [Aspergillus arachidicola]|uniref:Uncharacterized protein n=1 Tax=Aspergillus arachidicola TaxID=656916 RepID=A0A5N6XLT9_9EURO|nr:hypothetical protein BDV24DRAFT_146332 [Aspergillus arachidicola]